MLVNQGRLGGVDVLLSDGDKSVNISGQSGTLTAYSVDDNTRVRRIRRNRGSKTSGDQTVRCFSTDIG